MSFHELIGDYPWLVKRVARVVAHSDGRGSRDPRPASAGVPLRAVRAADDGRGRRGLGADDGRDHRDHRSDRDPVAAARQGLRERVGDDRRHPNRRLRRGGLRGPAGNYGSLECLAAPAQPGCIEGYAPGEPTFLDADARRRPTKFGYRRSFVRGGARPLRGTPGPLLLSATAPFRRSRARPACAPSLPTRRAGSATTRVAGRSAPGARCRTTARSCSRAEPLLRATRLPEKQPTRPSTWPSRARPQACDTRGEECDACGDP